MTLGLKLSRLRCCQFSKNSHPRQLLPDNCDVKFDLYWRPSLLTLEGVLPSWTKGSRLEKACAQWREMDDFWATFGQRRAGFAGHTRKAVPISSIIFFDLIEAPNLKPFASIARAIVRVRVRAHGIKGPSCPLITVFTNASLIIVFATPARSTSF